MLAQQRSCRLLVTPQSSSDPLEKNGCKQPPPLGNCLLFGSPLPSEFSLLSLGGRGVWIFSGTTHCGKNCHVLSLL